MKNTKIDRIVIINKSTGISHGVFSITQLKEAKIIADNMNYHYHGSLYFDVRIDNVPISLFNGLKIDLTKYEKTGMLDKPKRNYKYTAQL